MDQISRSKVAESISVLGAGILGAGLALWWREVLGAFAVHLLVAGVIAHGIGMYLKRKSEPAGIPQPRWFTWLYVVCWIAIAAALVVRLIT